MRGRLRKGNSSSRPVGTAADRLTLNFQRPGGVARLEELRVKFLRALRTDARVYAADTCPTVRPAA